MIRGLDVSVYQGTIDWHALPPEFAFVIGRASLGTAGLDTLYEKNRRGAHETGRVWGAYHFLLTDYPIDVQIELFWRAIGDTMPALPLVIDAEQIGKGETLESQVDALERAADATEAKAGKPPLIYSYPNWFRRLGAVLAARTSLKRCPLFLADYDHGANPPDGTVFARVPLWDAPTIVQTIGDKSPRVPGIVGAVDHDVFLGTMQELREGLCGLPAPKPDTMPEIVHAYPDLIPPDPPEE